MYPSKNVVRGILFAAACLAASASMAQPNETLTTAQKKVVAYLPGYATNAKRAYSIDGAPGFPTHLIYGFAGLKDNGVNPATGLRLNRRILRKTSSNFRLTVKGFQQRNS
jgi:hypothetical protein